MISNGEGSSCRNSTIKAFSLSLVLALISGCGHEEPRIRSEGDESRVSPQTCSAPTSSKVGKANANEIRCDD